MNIHSKRILILFSVALNIGFVITAIIVFYMHPPRPWPSHFRIHAEKAIERLNLTTNQRQSVTATMDRFGQERQDSHRAFHQVRSKMLNLLAQPGPLDQRQFDSIMEETNQLVAKKHREIRNHVLEIRKQLGDENGAKFFAAMLTQVEAEKECP